MEFPWLCLASACLPSPAMGSTGCKVYRTDSEDPRAILDRLATRLLVSLTDYCCITVSRPSEGFSPCSCRSPGNVRRTWEPWPWPPRRRARSTRRTAPCTPVLLFHSGKGIRKTRDTRSSYQYSRQPSATHSEIGDIVVEWSRRRSQKSSTPRFGRTSRRLM